MATRDGTSHRSTRGRLLIAALGAGTLLTTAIVSQAPGATLTGDLTHRPQRADRDRHDGWTSAWGAAVQRPTPGTADTGPNWSKEGFDNDSLRQIVRVTTGGRQLRVRLSNRYGRTPLRIRSAAVARTAKGAATRPGTSRPLRFDGAPGATLAPGADRASDALTLITRPGERLTLTLHTGPRTGPATFHRFMTATSYRAQGDHVQDSSARPFTEHTSSWYYLAGVDVRRHPATPSRERAGSIAVYGDSLVDGVGSSPGRDNRFTDALARRLAHTSPQPPGLLNAGIAGNKLLHPAPCYGASGISRFSRDALDQPGVRAVIIHLGANDIGASASGDPCAQPAPDITAAQLIAGHKTLIRAAHARGIKAIGATIIPLKGARFPFWTERGERIRQQVNHWIRTSHAYDAVLDTAKTLSNPHGDPATPNPTLVFDDGVHPNDKGHQALADAVDLRELHAAGITGPPSA
ncbi:SGNH/GDSL hydrolase family protein [Streptomyces smyrnaeus]|uniref:SGNH/GDSL hydrolase family protein n=1 Tax=Streptomyces smyrnaeus TaxID=1387713 RepID=UPI0036B0AD09